MSPSVFGSTPPELLRAEADACRKGRLALFTRELLSQGGIQPVAVILKVTPLFLCLSRVEVSSALAPSAGVFAVGQWHLSES